MADKKNDKKIKEASKEKDLEQVTGGRAEMPARPEDRKGPKQNLKFRDCQVKCVN